MVIKGRFPPKAIEQIIRRRAARAHARREAGSFSGSLTRPASYLAHAPRPPPLRYVAEYVTCSSCKSPATAMQKQNRLYFMQCNNCGARRSVAPIKTGFVAIGKGARRKARQ